MTDKKPNKQFVNMRLNRFYNPLYILIRLVITAVLLMSVFAAAGEIRGRVVESGTGRSLGNVEVTIVKRDLSDVTDSSGMFEFVNIVPGTYNIDFYKEGYKKRTKNDVYVSGKKREYVEISLSKNLFRLDKMVVHGSSFEKQKEMVTSTKIMDRDELMRVPGALADVQRAVQYLPSVVSGADNVNEVIVRGGMKGENLFVMDNIDIPNPNHFAAQGSGGGVMSVVNPLLVKKVTFNAGPPPAKYGTKASSVLDVELREGNSEMIIGGIDIGVAGAGGHVEGPMWKNASFMASATKSYLDFIAEFEPSTAVPDYWAGQAKMTQKYNYGKFYLNGLGGGSSIVIRDAGETLDLQSDVISSGSRTYAGGGTWEHYWNEYVTSFTTLSATGISFDNAGFDRVENRKDTVFSNSSSNSEQNAKFLLDFAPSERLKMSYGADAKRCAFDVKIFDKPDTLKSFTSDGSGGIDTSIVTDSLGRIVTRPSQRKDNKDGWKYSGFVSAAIDAGEMFSIVPGIRADGFTFNDNNSLSPRLGVEFLPVRDLNFSAAFGIQHQEPEYYKLVQHKDNRDLPAKQTMTLVAETEYVYRPMQMKFSIEGFYKRYENISEDTLFFDRDSVFDFMRSYRLSPSGRGKSAGIELFAQKKITKNWFFTAAYSFYRSFQKFPGLMDNRWYPSDYDYRNVLTLTGGCKFELHDREWYKRLKSKTWFKYMSPVMIFADRNEFSSRFRVRGGRPWTPRRYDSLHRRWVRDMTRINGERLEPYHRLDIRWERRYGFGFLYLVYYIEFQNVYGRENIWSYIYNDDNPEPVRINQLPFFPAGGIIIGF